MLISDLLKCMVFISGFILKLTLDLLKSPNHEAYPQDLYSLGLWRELGIISIVRVSSIVLVCGESLAAAKWVAKIPGARTLPSGREVFLVKPAYICTLSGCHLFLGVGGIASC